MPPLPHACQKPGCNAAFASEKELRRHCDHAEDHDFCKKCNYLAQDWDDLTAHKVNSPRPHLCCKFCGLDFKTSSGRDRHIKQLHPVDQDLRCKGCNEHFTRSAALIEHLEFDYCPKISAQQFKAHLQQKNVLAKILKNPENMNNNPFDLESTTDAESVGGVRLEGSVLGGSSVNGSSTLLDEDTTDGAGPLENPGGGSVMQPLVPEKKAHDPRAPNLGERWPDLPSHKNTDSVITGLGSSMAGVSLEDPPQGRAPFRNGAQSTSSSFRASTSTDPSDVSSVTTEKPSNCRSGVWGGSTNSSEVLFKGSKKTPLTNEFEAALKQRNEEWERGREQNILWVRAWDPTHKDYNPERFFNTVIEKYECPMPQCGKTYDEPFMFEQHVAIIHAVSQMRCPHCLKLFKSSTALVAHCESPTSTCGIARSDRYGQAIDLFSGGFLGATDARRPDITPEERKDKMDDDGKIVKGSGLKLGYVKYESTLPSGWSSDYSSSDNGVQIGRQWDHGGRGPNRPGRPVNPSVPKSDSLRQHHSTASIYPQPFEDYMPDPSKKTLAPRDGEKHKKHKENVIHKVIDPDNFHAKNSNEVFDEEPMRVMRRDEARYLSAEKDDATSYDDSVSGSSTTGRRSAWE